LDVCDAPEAGYTEFIEAIIKDIHSVHIILNSVNGHGKSSSLRTIIAELKRRDPEITLKIFDISQAWFHCAPVKFRQRVTPQTLAQGIITNLGDCVYEMGSLLKEQKRAFVASIIDMDYRTRYDIGLDQGIDAVKKLPFIIYVFEEASCYFDSWSITMRQNDPWSPILYNFVMVGRNYGLRSFMVVSSEQGELCPKMRRRSTRLLGRVESKEDLANYRGKSKWLGEVVKSIPKYNFVYWNGAGFGPFRIRDLVKSAPVDYVSVVAEVAPVEQKRGAWWYLSRVAIVAVAVFMFLKSVFNR